MSETNSAKTERHRVVTWADPSIGATAALTMSGLEYLKAMAAGEIPSPAIAKLVNFQFVEFEEGRAVFGVDPAEYHYNPYGSAHS